ncbi:hypothetical protein FACS1894164_14500 [Spirochaetia bacterium]|nr:hypothetical protein FACS1894164_14500 [Spirochaetia bacterium]
MKKFLYGLVIGTVILYAACEHAGLETDSSAVQTPPGMGMVRVSFSDGAARTIYPDKTFDHYVYTFTKVGESTGQVKTPAANGVFTLETGSWNLSVQAYANASNTSLAAMGSTTTAFTVSQNTVTDNIVITLSPAVSTGEGTLNYSITYPAAGVIQTLSFVQVGGGTSTNLQTDASISSTGGLSTLTGTKTAISAGYYLIRVILKDGSELTAGKSEVVHIYNNLTTTLNFNFSASEFTAAINANAATPVITSVPVGTSYIQHASAFPIDVGASVNDGGTLSFQWYSNASNSTTGGTAIYGETGASYTPSTAAVGTVYYYVVLSNTNNTVNGNTTATVTSSVAAITVITPEDVIVITVANIDQMKSLVAAAAAAGGGTSKTNPIVVAITISDASLLSGTNSEGTDLLHKLFDAIPSSKYVSYDLSGSTFTSFGDITYDTAYARTNKSYLASISLPETLTTIGSNTFSNCSGLTDITIPNSVTTIGGMAFRSCSGLRSISIGNSVISIGSYAFSYCSGLTSVSIGNSVISIGSYAFSYCSGLTSVSIGNSVTSIGEAAFRSCSELTSVSIGNRVTTIGDLAFSYCSGLTEITIPNSVTTIGGMAFRSCSGLRSISIPNSVTSIDYSTFSGCSRLASVSIPNSVISIGDNAFSGCSRLASVSIPNSVISIGDNAFSGCSSLTSIEVNTSNPFYKSIEGVLFNQVGTELVAYPNGKGATTYTIPNSVTTIGNSAFSDCSRLASVSIPNSVESIGSSAFWGCSGLTEITIPNSVTTIGNSAFRGCYSLTSVYVQRDTEPLTTLGIYAFDDTHSSLQIYVPASKVIDYRTAWTSYADEIEAAP